MAWATLPTYVPLTRRGPSDPGSRGLRNTLYVVACLCLVSITAAVVHIAAKQKGCADQQLTAGPAAAAAADGLTSQGQQAGPYVVESTTNVSIKDARMLVQQQATGAQPPPALPPLRAGVPRLIHHMHKSYDALTPSQKMFYERCKVMHPHWEFKFWDDAALQDFIKTNFSWYWDTWSSIEPLIKKLDSSRYMLMQHFGGIYMDVDVECVTPFDSLIDPLPPGAAWVGDNPEPMFLMSAPGNKVWLHVLERIKRVWKDLDAWHSTGPAGLNTALLEYVHTHGTGALVPWVTHRSEPEFLEFAKAAGKNGSVPWYPLAQKQVGMPTDCGIKTWTDTNAARPDQQPPKDNQFSCTPPLPADQRVGFIANELLDPPACSAAEIQACPRELCARVWPYAYIVHHCLNTWRGRIGTT